MIDTKHSINTFDWDFKILNGQLTDTNIQMLICRCLEIKGDPARLILINKKPIIFHFTDFDDFYLTILFNLLIKANNNFRIEIARLDHNRKPIYKIVYSGCKIVKSRSSAPLNGNKDTVQDIYLYFDYTTREILKIDQVDKEIIEI